MKRFLALTLCLLLLCSPALSETFSVYYEPPEHRGYYMLVRDDGTPLTPPDTYGIMYTLFPEGTPDDRQRYCVMPFPSAGRYDDLDDSACLGAIMNSDGTLLTRCAFDPEGVSTLGSAIVIYDSDYRMGLMDIDGRVIVEPEYSDIANLGDGYYMVLQWEDAGDGSESYCATVIKPDGSKVDTGLHSARYCLGDGGDGLCIVYDATEYDGQDVYVDREGKVRIVSAYSYIEAFHDRFAIVEQDGLYGLIDRLGSLVEKPQYRRLYYAGTAPDDVYIAERGTELTVISAQTGEVLMSRDFAPACPQSFSLFAGDLLFVETDDACYCFRTDGALLSSFTDLTHFDMEPVWDDASEPRLIKRSKDSYKARLVDLYGNPVSGEYDDIRLAMTQDGQSLYYIQDYGQGGSTGCMYSSREGVIDQDGRLVLPPIYGSYVSVLSPDRFWVSDGVQTGMVDRSGKWYYAISDYQWLVD